MPDLNFNKVNNVFYSPEDMTGTEITADIYIDRASIEIFIDGGPVRIQWKEKPSREIRKDFFFGEIILK